MHYVCNLNLHIGKTLWNSRKTRHGLFHPDIQVSNRPPNEGLQNSEYWRTFASFLFRIIPLPTPRHTVRAITTNDAQNVFSRAWKCLCKSR